MVVYSDFYGNVYSISFDPESLSGHGDSLTCLEHIKKNIQEIPVFTDVTMGFRKVGAKVLKIDPPAETGKNPPEPSGIVGMVQKYVYFSFPSNMFPILIL